MKTGIRISRRTILIILISIVSLRASAAGDIYQIKIYQIKDAVQESKVDHFLQTAYLPALHRAGISKVGVFKPLANDTSSVRKIYVFISYQSTDQWRKTQQKLDNDTQFASDGADYLHAAYNDAPYLRIESILLEAFSGMIHPAVPDLKGPKNERIYELRSYEGPTELIHANKVQMFIKGDEIGLFKRLGFNAVFYAEVISGAHMPNLMYMTSFENMASHDQHWKSFVADDYWKKLSAMPEYQNNVSHIDIVLMHPADYSDF